MGRMRSTQLALTGQCLVCSYRTTTDGEVPSGYDRSRSWWTLQIPQTKRCSFHWSSSSLTLSLRTVLRHCQADKLFHLIPYTDEEWSSDRMILLYTIYIQTSLNKLKLERSLDNTRSSQPNADKMSLNCCSYHLLVRFTVWHSNSLNFHPVESRLPREQE